MEKSLDLLERMDVTWPHLLSEPASPLELGCKEGEPELMDGKPSQLSLLWTLRPLV